MVCSPSSRSRRSPSSPSRRCASSASHARSGSLRRAAAQSSSCGACCSCVCALLGIAAAQPVWRSTERQQARTESQVFFVVDVSRSMAAAEGPSGRTRLARARAAVVRLRDAVPAVPAGLAGLTDRVLPYLFPTLDRAGVRGDVARSVLIESPPPQQVSTNATSFEALAVARARRLLRPRRRPADVCPRHRRRNALVLAGRRGRRSSQGRAAAGCSSSASVRRRAGLRRRRRRRRRAMRPIRQRPTRRARSPRPPAGEAFSEDDLAAAAAALKRAADVGPVGRRRTSATDRLWPRTRQRLPWSPSRPARPAAHASPVAPDPHGSVSF